MAYFSNGSEGDGYQEQWCSRCMNWREHSEIPENWGCIVWDLHLCLNYDQCRDDGIKRVLEHFIPTDDDGYPMVCRMFVESVNADIPGQMRMF